MSHTPCMDVQKPLSFPYKQDEVLHRSKNSRKQKRQQKPTKMMAAKLSVFFILFACTTTTPIESFSRLSSRYFVDALIVPHTLSNCRKTTTGITTTTKSNRCFDQAGNLIGSSMLQLEHRRNNIVSSPTTIKTSLHQTSSNAIDNNAENHNNNFPPMVTEIDVLYGYKTPLVYDSTLERYVPLPDDDDDDDRRQNDGTHISSSRINGASGGSNNNKRMGPLGKLNRKVRARFIPTLRAAFLPEGVAPSYYKFVKWRFLQRYVNANVHVIGTQSLLLGLGLKTKNLGLSAAMNWVLKDALGKMTRMLWASKMGRKFDSDAKRWRFRSSLLFALGNFLEIVTYIFPQLFLLWATLSNCFKQISMLTSSSTRTALYNSFRDGSRENIGDIVAKGEAQIAVVDLLGIGSGVMLSRLIGMSTRRVLLLYIMLQTFEIFCMYKEISAVEFRVLNFERLIQVVNKFVESTEEQSHVVIPTPTEMSKSEKIFLPPQDLERRAIAFGSMGRAKLAPDELSNLMTIFSNEKFLLVVGADVKNRRKKRRMIPDPAANCHVVLHVDAKNVDIVKGTLALSILRRKLVKKAQETSSQDDSTATTTSMMRTRDCFDLIEESKNEASAKFPILLKKMSLLGWATPARFMFGRVTMRSDWPLLPVANQSQNNTIKE
mmetsp:Transcript_7612/g.10828  ORF Transcript_7612/g.10828 Transcript_7612/m.10828 type:complete len:660 (-) Transcript_7612:228-2207(-)